MGRSAVLWADWTVMKMNEQREEIFTYLTQNVDMGLATKVSVRAGEFGQWHHVMVYRDGRPPWDALWRLVSLYLVSTGLQELGDGST